MKPTDSEIREFLEWCGFEEIVNYNNYNHLYWKAPDGWEYPIIPVIDLNNLFKYAVPKVRYISLVKPDGKSTYSASARNGVGIVGDVGYCFDNEDPADTVFWAIHKVMKGVKDG